MDERKKKKKEEKSPARLELGRKKAAAEKRTLAGSIWIVPAAINRGELMNGTWPKMEALKGKSPALLMSPASAFLAARNWGFSSREEERPWQSWLDGGKTIAGFQAKGSPQKASVKGLRFADGARATGGVPGSRPCLLMSYLELQFGIGSRARSLHEGLRHGVWEKIAKYRLVYLFYNGS
jgi:hypothetical protein